jgi:hypothetical protein
MLLVHDTKIEANHGLYYNSCIKGENNINPFHIPKAAALLVLPLLTENNIYIYTHTHTKIWHNGTNIKDNKVSMEHKG